MTGTSPKPEEKDDSKVVQRECPFEDCDWSIEDEITFYADEEHLDYKAERHYEREHAGRIRVTLAFESERLHGDRDLSKIRERYFEHPPDVPGFKLGYVRTQIIESPDDHSKIEEGPE